MSIRFPVYRKLLNERSYYLVMDSNSFIEFQFIGTKIIRSEFISKNYYDRLLLSDLINKRYPYIQSSKEEFQKKNLFKKKEP